jgi:hypothetical protein
MSVLLLLFLAGPPDAGSASVSASPAPAKVDDESEAKICKRIPVSGTLAGYQRVCRTRAEWQQAAGRDRQARGSSRGRDAAPETKVQPE